eukprot:COSAG02_NODE_469_length_21727_cov_64.506334_1_plen_908_part_00
MLSGTFPVELCVSDAAWTRQIDFHNMCLEGSVPSLTGCTRLESLRLTSNSLTGFSTHMPQALTHLYLDANPLNATAEEVQALMANTPNLRAMTIDIMSAPVVLADTAVAAPTDCRVGGECSWILQLYDADDQPALTGLLVQGLQLGFNCTADDTSDNSRQTHQSQRMHSSCRQYTDMIDNLDGTFTATVPRDWVRIKGIHRFRFFHGTDEIQPSWGGDGTNKNYPGFDTLRTVSFAPIECEHEPYTEPDSTGSMCICQSGYTRQSPTDPCFRTCGNGTSVVNGSTCLCPRNTYDVRHAGVILCTAHDWTADNTEYSDEIATLKPDHSVCLKCPDQCASCAGGVANLSEGWRLNGTSLSQIRGLLRGAAFRPQFAYQCPSAAYENVTCPPMLLDATFNSTSDAHCLSHHTGPLCAICEQGYSRRNSDGSCKRCSDASVFQDHFGLSRNQFAVSVLAAALLLGALVYWRLDRIRRAKQQLSTMLKIALGLSQVLALLKDVLNLVFPPVPRHTMSYVAMLTADLNALYEFDCNGWDWFSKWSLTVFFVPSIGIVLVGTRYAWQRWHKRDPNARSNGTAALFLMILLLYPRVSSTILSALRCRVLGSDMQVLEVDYSVDCLSLHYQRYRTAAFVSLALWPIGIPFGLLGLLWKNWRHNVKQFQTFSNGASQSYAVDVADDALSVAQYSKTQLMHRYAFCLNDYRPEAWWFEPADMLRKLALSGLLQFVERGTAAQVLVGCCISFASFGVHVRLLPYREVEANVLKVCAEAVLFLTFLISFILRVLPRVEAYEPVGAEAYGYLLLSAFGVFTVLFFGLVVRQAYRRHRFQQGLLASGPGFESNSDGQELSVLTQGTSGQPGSDIPPTELPNMMASESTMLEEPLVEVAADEHLPRPATSSPLERLYMWVASQ